MFNREIITRFLLRRPAALQSRTARWTVLALAAIGAAFLVWSAVIHLELRSPVCSRRREVLVLHSFELYGYERDQISYYCLRTYGNYSFFKEIFSLQLVIV